MFESAIEKISQYTRPLHTISRTYAGMVLPGTATFFFVNEDGFAVTCKHVASLISSADLINANYVKFREARNSISQSRNYSKELKALEQRFSYVRETSVQIKHNFMNCFDRVEQIVSHFHPTLDLAILQFKGFNQIFYKSSARFVRDSSSIKQGKYLCRFGYPFPEFSNFKHDATTDDIVWTETGNPNSPSFPIDGIITRFVADPGQPVAAIEMSTPGLRGQSGGPLFDPTGAVYGIQYATNHLHLGFDITGREIIDNGKKSVISNHPFLHVGLCIHVDRIKDFLRFHQVSFTETE